MATLTAPKPRTRAHQATTTVHQTLTSPKYGPVLVTAVLLIVMFGVGGLRYDNFVSPQVMVNLFVDNAYLIVLAVGMTFVILTGGIDLSVGAVVALSTMIAASLLQSGFPPLAVIVIVLLTTSLLGLGVGLMIHVFGVPYRVSTSGPRAWAVYRQALEAAWERGDGVGELDLDAYDAAAELDAAENRSPERPVGG